MRWFDGLAFLGPALLLIVGMLADPASEPTMTIMAIIGAVWLVNALWVAGWSFRVVMNFADDMGLKHGISYAALWMMRVASAFWLWNALAFLALGFFHVARREVFFRGAVLSASIGVIIFVLGVAWFVIYAGAKQQVHKAG